MKKYGCVMMLQKFLGVINFESEKKKINILRRAEEKHMLM
jgi:hypothetical protein